MNATTTITLSTERYRQLLALLEYVHRYWPKPDSLVTMVAAELRSQLEA